MKNSSNLVSKSSKAPLPVIPQKFKDSAALKEIMKQNYNKENLYEGRKAKLSISSQSSTSKDPYTASEKCLSIDESVNDVSRSNPTPSRLLQENNGYKFKQINQIRKIPKIDLKESNYVKSLQDLSSCDNPPRKSQLPNITAKCWVLMDALTGEIISSTRERKRREIASLTKMMNLLCVCKLIQEYGIDPKNTYVKVSKHAAMIKGTSANLRNGDIVLIWDLLHGLMLPSGNDAAYALAENFGMYIYLRSDEYKAKCEKEPETRGQEIKNPGKYFLKLMNQTAKDLGLFDTHYANPHGLMNPNSYSTAADQAKLTQHLLKSDIITEIISKKAHSCEIEQYNKKIRPVLWENTNRLLGRPGWYGAKTGITDAAGPCLSACYKNQDVSYIIILLNSASTDIRWLESHRLVEWAIKNKDKTQLSN